MSWKSKVARKYTDPHIKVMLILQKHHIYFISEQPFRFSEKRGDGLKADIYLMGKSVRVECDDPFFKKDMEPYLEKDERLKEIFGIDTVRLENRKIMLVSGEQYVLEKLKEWIS